MDSSDGITTPKTLTRRCQLLSKAVSPQRPIAVHSGITSQRSPQIDKRQPSLQSEFCGFLGPSSPPGSSSFLKLCSPSKTNRRRPDGITVLSRALRQRQSERDTFPPPPDSLGSNLQNTFLNTTKKGIVDNHQDSLHSVDSSHRSTGQNVVGSKSPRRALSPSFKTPMIKEMHPAVIPAIPNHELKARDDTQEYGSQMLLLPINKKVVITEITDQTDRYKQLAGHRTFSIKFDASDAQQEKFYKRRPYLLHNPSKEQRRTRSPAKFNSIFTNPQYSGLILSPNSHENILSQMVQARHANAEEAMTSTSESETTDDFKVSNTLKDPKIVGGHQYNSPTSIRKLSRTPFPLV